MYPVYDERKNPHIGSSFDAFLETYEMSDSGDAPSGDTGSDTGSANDSGASDGSDSGTDGSGGSDGGGGDSGGC